MRTALAWTPLAALLCLSAPAAPAAGAEPPQVIALLPGADAALGIVPGEPAEHFVGRRLFDYMDGGAELYLGFGFDELGVRRYRLGDASARVAIYRMGGPAEAFGICAFGGRGTAQDVGGPASLTNGMLSFFRGRFYVRVVAETPATQATAALLALGRATYARLPGDSLPPAELAHLPEGALPGSQRYLVHPDTARTLWLEGEADVLFEGGGQAVLALYPGADGDLQLTRAAYPSPTAAGAAAQALGQKLGLKPADGGLAGVGPDETHQLVRVEGAVLRWVGGARDATEAAAWLAKLR
ncbi:MAG TPA: hypothetical protein PK668_12265 [Myxococcota bacterium]|nr:hypothetical protein [Myxococcota bacterium]HRY93757.1 hypothetical protein [Myxococcota bacterium]HSA22235.1 hypothetical protein [Myxococcota bacterium]